jgi:hypothetical protein
MASPLKTGKQTVSLASPGVRVSRIRRDPPPAVKEVTLEDQNERDARTVVIGVLIFTLALVIVLLGFTDLFGHSPRNYTAHL